MSDEQNAQATDQTSMSDIADTVIPQKVSEPVVDPNDPADNVQDFQQFADRLTAVEEQGKVNTATTDQLTSAKQDEKFERDLTGAAEKINENVDGKIGMAKLFLEHQYRENPDLQKVWDNRGNNQEAFNKALVVLQREYDAFSLNEVDPQIKENQRALQASQEAGGTVQVVSESDENNALGDGDFMRKMTKLARSG